jgi:RNA polymerase sigma factor (sigma-70 family)
MTKFCFDVISQLASLRRYARALTRSDADAEDLVHDALVRAYEKRSSYHDSRSLKPWLLSIMHNIFVDGRRASGAETRQRLGEASLQDAVLSPVQFNHVRLVQVRRAFMKLPLEQRTALHLVAIEGLTFAEAAGLLDIPIGTLMSRLGRARATLRAVEDGTLLWPLNTKRQHLKIVGGSDEHSR